MVHEIRTILKASKHLEKLGPSKNTRCRALNRFPEITSADFTLDIISCSL